MKNLWILVKMQLKEQLNFKRLELEHVGAFQILLSILAAVLKFALITALCGAFLIVAKSLRLFSLTDMPIPSTVISIVFSVMLLMSVISCVVGLTKSMYYARDNSVLLTLPCLPIQVYLSKLIIFFVFEVKRNFTFIVPLFIAYFATGGYSFGAYPWMLFCILWVSLFTVALGALLSIPAMWIANFFRQHKWLQMTALVVVVASASVLLFFGISLIPENIDPLATWETTYWDIQAVLEGYATNLSPLYDLTRMILGETKHLSTTFPIGRTVGRLAVVVGATAVLLALGLMIVRPLFYKMASTPFEYLKKKTKPKENRVLHRRAAPVYTETLISIRDSSRMFSNVGILIAIPMLIFLLNKIFLAMNTRDMGDHMVVAFNVLIVLLVALNANCYAASIFSRDGRSSYLIKTQPSKYPLLILSKLLPNSVFVFFSFVATYVVLLLSTSLGFFNTTFLTVAMGMTYLVHMLYSAEQDLMNPQTELYATVGSSESNPNETLSTLTAFLLSFGIAGAIFLLLEEGGTTEGSVYIKYALLAAVALAYRVHIFFQKLRLYYKEK